MECGAVLVIIDGDMNADALIMLWDANATTRRSSAVIMDGISISDVFVMVERVFAFYVVVDLMAFCEIGATRWSVGFGVKTYTKSYVYQLFLAGDSPILISTILIDVIIYLFINKRLIASTNHSLEHTIRHYHGRRRSGPSIRELPKLLLLPPASKSIAGIGRVKYLESHS